MEKKKFFNQILNFLGVLLFLYPAFNGITGLVKDPKLDGAVELKKDTSFSLKGWWDGTWQEPKEEYLSEKFGCRNYFVRLHNEIDFRIFHKGHARNLVIGKEDILYERDYILTYFGKDFLGTDVITNNVNKIKEAQRILSEKGKTLIVVLAAGKGSFYPEYFPVEFDSMKRGPTNFEETSKLATDAGVNFIDFSVYFKNQKGNTPYLLYPKYGVHWSQYAMTLAADSLVRFIESKRFIKMQHFKWNEIALKRAKDIDYDIGSGMNLLSYLNGPKMGYPKIFFEENKGEVKPSIVVIADSFYWGIFNMGFSNLFSKSHFWSYNNEVYPEHYKSPTYVNDLDLASQLNDHDVFVLMATEHNIAGAGWGFVDAVINLENKNEVK